MNYHSPQRQRNYYSPLFLGGHFAINFPALSPTEDGWALKWWLPIEETSMAQLRSMTIPRGELEATLEAFEHSPEDFLRNSFGWTPPAKFSPLPTELFPLAREKPKVLSLADLAKALGGKT
jgi:hypothetical protein